MAYLALGFVFMEYWQLIVLMSISAVIGSWLGVRLRHRMPMAWLKGVMPWILTVIALQVMVKFVLERV